MLVCDYIVEQIDGDYAHLRRVDLPDEELKLVARALLPAEIVEGCKLHYELFLFKEDCKEDSLLKIFHFKEKEIFSGRNPLCTFSLFHSPSINLHQTEQHHPLHFPQLHQNHLLSVQQRLLPSSF